MLGGVGNEPTGIYSELYYVYSRSTTVNQQLGFKGVCPFFTLVCKCLPNFSPTLAHGRLELIATKDFLLT